MRKQQQATHPPYSPQQSRTKRLFILRICCFGITLLCVLVTGIFALKTGATSPSTLSSTAFTVIVGVFTFFQLVPLFFPSKTEPPNIIHNYYTSPSQEDASQISSNSSQSQRTSIAKFPPIALSHALFTNFYFNEPLPDYSEFYGRRRHRSTLINRTRNKASTSIVGPRRIGKTWLVNYLRMVAFAELGSSYLFVELDATAYSISTVTGFVTKAGKGFGHPTSLHAGMVELEDVVERLVEQDRTPVLCIDEFEGFQHHQREFDEEFFRGLRAVTQKGLVLVLASKQPLKDIIGNAGITSGFFNIFEQIQLEPFNHEEVEEFVHVKSEKARFTEAERTFLFQYGSEYGPGGVRRWPPLRLQLVGKMLLEDKLHQRCHPSNAEYRRMFEQELKQKYEAVIH